MKDVDLGGARLIIRSAKGNKDRMVPLPQCVLGELETTMRYLRPSFGIRSPLDAMAAE